jgi:hypothetical protein
MFVGHLAVACSAKELNPKIPLWVSQPWAAPPNPGAVAGMGIALWILPIWAAWIERNRVVRRRA